jgi:hypothetical protein
VTIGWPLVVIFAIIMVSVVAVISAAIAGRAAMNSVAQEGKSDEHYRTLAADYEGLAKQTRDVQNAMQADLADLRKRMESIERMMREVG